MMHDRDVFGSRTQFVWTGLHMMTGFGASTIHTTSGAAINPFGLDLQMITDSGASMMLTTIGSWLQAIHLDPICT